MTDTSLKPDENASRTAETGVLTLDGLGVTYSTSVGPKRVLDDVALTVGDGEFVCIVGPSGAGKTTLVRCLAGLMLPTSGVALLDGVPISEPPARLALVSQDYSRSLMPWLRIDDNVGLPLRGKGISREDMHDRVMRGLEAVGLTAAARSYPWQLSGGMQQRAAIARALAYRPEVLIMDEPFASVDAQTRAELEDLILRLQRDTGMTTLLVTHDIDESVYLADRVIVLGGTPATIMRTIDVDLGAQRDQLATKSLPEFLTYRNEVLLSIRAARLQNQ